MHHLRGTTERGRAADLGPRFLLLGLPLLVAGCAAAPPRVDGVAGVPPGPSVPWTPPAWPAAGAPAPDEILPEPLTLAAAIDAALRASPETRAAWFEAQAAGARFGAVRGAWWPTLDAEVSSAWDEVGDDRTTTPSAGARLSWLLLDLGGRAADVDAAKQALIAANFTHAAAVRDRALDVQVAWFAHAGAQAILAANRASLADAQRSLEAAEARHDLGLATVADVLQARTALSQVRLDVQATEGQVRTTRGALAVAMGRPATAAFTLAEEAAAIPAAATARDVDELIARALAERPDLQAAQARARELAAQARSRRAALWPTLALDAYADRRWNDGEDRHGAALVLEIPLFAGGARRHAARAAEAAAGAEAERARGREQAVVFDVFLSHSDFQTATERVATSADLLASATESERVAAGRYREGVGTVLDLLSAQRALAQARAQEINARLDWFVALARLAHDVGGLDIRAPELLRAPE